MSQSLQTTQRSTVPNYLTADKPDGSPAKRPRKSTDPRAMEPGVPIKIPDRFVGLV